jgi:TonB family protein
MGSFLRLFIAVPIAFTVTTIIFLGLYNQLSPKPFLYTTPEEPQAIYLGNEILCMCRPPDTYGFLPSMPQPDTSNSWTESEKAVKETPSIDQEDSPPFEICPGEGVPCTGGQNTSKPRPSGYKLAPDYPEKCKQLSAAGAVVFQYDITPEGRTTNIKIINSAHDCFNETVIRYVRQWRFRPIVGMSGKPVWRRGEIGRISFALDED